MEVAILIIEKEIVMMAIFMERSRKGAFIFSS